MTGQAHKLGEVLRTAREAKGVDLGRVERETKIRERYLGALERGEYRDLPGAVYTKGFLRNYGAYLGLDPEYLIDLYRLETEAAPVDGVSLSAPPRPIAVRRRRTFVVTPGAIVAAILTIMVGGLVAWLGYEFVNFARTPELRITRPAGNVAAHPDMAITIGGVTAPNATVTVRGLRENPSVQADGTGDFEVTVGLMPGSNVIRLTAFDPVTNRNSAETMRTVEVVRDDASSPTPSAVALALEQPTADATFTGPVSIAGTGAPSTSLGLASSLVSAPAPTFTITDASNAPVPISPVDPVAPAPTTLEVDATGAFTGSLSLPPGTWDITLTPDAGEPITRRVTMQPAGGLTAVLRISGGASYLEVSEDGTVLADVNGTIASDGQSVEAAAAAEIRVLAGDAGAVQVTVNGLAIGPMGSGGAVVEWRITRSDS